MKRILSLLALIVSLQAAAQWPWEKIEGNGKMTKETRPVSGYSAVSSSGAWDVMIAYGESNSIQVEGDENLLPYIETKVEGDKLVIRTTKRVNLRSRNRITVYVSMTRLAGVAVSGSGDIIGQGKFRFDGDSYFHVSGSGNIKMNFDRVGSADVSISGSGGIRLSGATQSVKARISGSGNADCSELVADDASAHISGSGDVKLNVNRSIDASISGSGNVSYRGAASDIKKHISGSGRLVKA
ncbi:MAG: DUF2807 domain-containing protein [Chitinophagaceae bacterium]|nr:DUF2807 domain-containing protein [Chitinophagaceae bacterium]